MAEADISVGFSRIPIISHFTPEAGIRDGRGFCVL